MERCLIVCVIFFTLANLDDCTDLESQFTHLRLDAVANANDENALSMLQLKGAQQNTHDSGSTTATDDRKAVPDLRSLEVQAERSLARKRTEHVDAFANLQKFAVRLIQAQQGRMRERSTDASYLQKEVQDSSELGTQVSQFGPEEEAEAEDRTEEEEQGKAQLFQTDGREITEEAKPGARKSRKSKEKSTKGRGRSTRHRGKIARRPALNPALTNKKGNINEKGNITGRVKCGKNWCLPVVRGSEGPGSPECPCITNASASYGKIASALVAAGLPAKYGIEGCAAYDENQTFTECQDNSSPHCLNAWCYVDPELCPINKTLCENAGGMVGSDKSPHCRDRATRYSKRLDGNPLYSYETCGSMNSYDEGWHQEAMAGRLLKVSVAPDTSRWLTVTKDVTGNTVYGGALWDFFMQSLSVYDPKPFPKVTAEFATNESRILFKSSYTACVHDVAIGVTDVCVADLWRTPERATMAEFSPTLKIDNLVLVVPTELQQETLLQRLMKPFKPFTSDAWCGVAILLSIMAIFRWCTGLVAEDRSSDSSVFWEFLGSFFHTLDDFLAGGSSADDKTTALKFFRISFAFFLLVIMASYTASLASMLVVKRHAVAAIPNIEFAIERKIPICVSGGIQQSISHLYPEARFVSIDSLNHAPASIYSGICDVAIMTYDYIYKMHSGEMKFQDCERGAQGHREDHEAHCETGWKGNPRNDCMLQPVGPVLLSVPVAFPVNPEIGHSLSWAISKQWSAGLFEEAKWLNAELSPRPACGVPEKSDMDGLTWFDLAGTAVISLLGLGLVLSIFLWTILAWPFLEHPADDGPVEGDSSPQLPNG